MKTGENNCSFLIFVNIFMIKKIVDYVFAVILIVDYDMIISSSLIIDPRKRLSPFVRQSLEE